MSVFAACVPEAECVAQLRALTEDLRPLLPRDLAWRNAQQWHVTVRHFGDSLLLPEMPLLALLESVAKRHAPFELVFDRLEFWPGPKVWVLRAEQSAPFVELFAGIESVARNCAYPAEKKAPTPHLTLAYARSREQPLPLTPPLLPIRLFVSHVHLLRTIPGAYARLHAWQLAGGGQA